jgi:hypothetical protein
MQTVEMQMMRLREALNSGIGKSETFIFKEEERKQYGGAVRGRYEKERVCSKGVCGNG